MRLLGAAFSDEQRLMQSDTGPGRKVTPDNFPQIAAALQKALTPERFSRLAAGRLVVTCDGRDSWSAWYESVQEPYFLLPLTGSVPSAGNNTSVIYGSNKASQAGTTFAFLKVWRSSLAEGELAELDNGLADPGVQLPVPDIEHILTTVGAGIEVQVQRPSRPDMVMHQSLSRLLGQQLEDSSHFWAPWFIIHHILERGLIFTDNVRRSPADTVPTAALHTPTDLASGENLGRYLLLKKNGSSADRKEFRRIGETFEQLTFGCHFDVGLREPARSRMPQSEEAAPGTLHLAITTNENLGDIPLEYSGAGRAEALFLSALIETGEAKVVLLDEPASNLHPTVQSRLVAKLRDSTQSQFFMVTHSPSLMDPSAISKTSRFSMEGGATQRQALAGGSKGAHLPRIEMELARSAEARAMLMAQAVILVEGATELSVLPVWFRNRCEQLRQKKTTAGSISSEEELVLRRFGSNDIAMFDVASDTHYGVFVSLLRQFAIPWAIVCDGAIIGGGRGRCNIWSQTRNAGVEGKPALSGRPFSERRTELALHGVFTVAESAKRPSECLEALPTIQKYWKDAVAAAHGRIPRSKKDVNKPRVAHWIASNYPTCPPEIKRLQDALASWFEKCQA